MELLQAIKNHEEIMTKKISKKIIKPEMAKEFNYF